jgi:hypothetical protein
LDKHEHEQGQHAKVKSLYYDEKTKVDNHKATISKLNSDSGNYNDLKSQGKDFFNKIHDEKVKFSKLNDQYNKAI